MNFLKVPNMHGFQYYWAQINLSSFSQSISKLFSILLTFLFTNQSSEFSLTSNFQGRSLNIIWAEDEIKKQLKWGLAFSPFLETDRATHPFLIRACTCFGKWVLTTHPHWLLLPINKLWLLYVHHSFSVPSMVVSEFVLVNAHPTQGSGKTLSEKSANTRAPVHCRIQSPSSPHAEVRVFTASLAPSSSTTAQTQFSLIYRPPENTWQVSICFAHLNCSEADTCRFWIWCLGWAFIAPNQMIELDKGASGSVSCFSTCKGGHPVLSGEGAPEFTTHGRFSIWPLATRKGWRGH